MIILIPYKEIIYRAKNREVKKLYVDAYFISRLSDPLYAVLLVRKDVEEFCYEPSGEILRLPDGKAEAWKVLEVLKEGLRKSEELISDGLRSIRASHSLLRSAVALGVIPWALAKRKIEDIRRNVFLEGRIARDVLKRLEVDEAKEVKEGMTKWIPLRILVDKSNIKFLPVKGQDEVYAKIYNVLLRLDEGFRREAQRIFNLSIGDRRPNGLHPT